MSRKSHSVRGPHEQSREFVSECFALHPRADGITVDRHWNGIIETLAHADKHFRWRAYFIFEPTQTKHAWSQYITLCAIRAAVLQQHIWSTLFEKNIFYLCFAFVELKLRGHGEGNSSRGGRSRTQPQRTRIQLLVHRGACRKLGEVSAS